MRFVWIIYCYFEDRFSLHGWLFPSSVRREHGQEGAEPTSPGFCFSGASSNSQPVRSLGRGPEVSARSSLLAAEAQALSSGRCLSPPAGPPMPRKSSGSRRLGAGALPPGAESPAGGGFSRGASADAGPPPGLPGPEVRCRARVPGAHELYGQRCSLHPGRPAPAPRSPSVPCPPQPLRPERPGRRRSPGRWSADCRALCDPRP